VKRRLKRDAEENMHKPLVKPEDAHWNVACYDPLINQRTYDEQKVKPERHKKQ
jgi:hypothetical protein